MTPILKRVNKALDDDVSKLLGNVKRMCEDNAFRSDYLTPAVTNILDEYTNEKSE